MGIWKRNVKYIANRKCWIGAVRGAEHSPRDGLNSNLGHPTRGNKQTVPTTEKVISSRVASIVAHHNELLLTQ